MAARMMRTAVRAALIARWSVLDGLAAGYAPGAPMPQITRHATEPWVGRERIVVDATDGTLTIPTQRAGTKTTQDDFEITVFVAVAIPGWSADDIEDRCIVVVEELLDDIASASGVTLGGVVPGLAWCRAGRTRTFSDLVDIAGAPTTAYMAELTLELMGRTT